jgi:DNA repair protein RadC
MPGVVAVSARVKPPCELKVMRVRECASDLSKVETPEAAADYWRTNIPDADWYDPDKEAFVTLLLNTRRRVIGHNLVSLGTLDSSLVSPLSVFRPAFAAAASAVILVHNHPSGDPTPSAADIRVTRDLAKAGQLLRIEILDHVIIGDTTTSPSFMSLREHGYFS